MACYIHSLFNRCRTHRASKAAVCRSLTYWLLRWAISLTFVFLLLLPYGLLADQHDLQLEFKGQVKIPEHSLRRRARILLVLNGVTSSYSGRESADSDGRFRFHNVKPGAYSLVIYLPGIGQGMQSIELTRSFSDAKGRIQKQL